MYVFWNCYIWKHNCFWYTGFSGDVLWWSRGKQTHNNISNTDDVAFDDEGNVIYSSYSQNKVRKQDMAGNILFSYTHEKLEKPFGLAVNIYGEIFVGGFASNNIHILSRSGQLLRILEGVRKPKWIKFQNDTNRLFVIDSDCNLKVFQFTAPHN